MFEYAEKLVSPSPVRGARRAEVFPVQTVFAWETLWQHRASSPNPSPRRPNPPMWRGPGDASVPQKAESLTASNQNLRPGSPKLNSDLHPLVSSCRLIHCLNKRPKEHFPEKKGGNIDWHTKAKKKKALSSRHSGEGDSRQSRRPCCSL